MSGAWDPDTQLQLQLVGWGTLERRGGSTSETRVTWCYGAPVPFHVFHCSREVFPSVSLNFFCCIFFPFPFVLA